MFDVRGPMFATMKYLTSNIKLRTLNQKKYFPILLIALVISCKTSPGRLKTLTKNGIKYQSQNTVFDIGGVKNFTVQYTGCGGLYLLKDGNGIMIDPFFSNQKIGRISASLLGGGPSGRKKLSANPKMINAGLKSIEDNTGSLHLQVSAIFAAHSHYDHLMDIPALLNKLNKKPTVYLNNSGFNTCYNVIDTNRMEVLENYMTTQETIRPPIELQTKSGKVHVYPILADHNPHFKNIKFFSGSKTSPVLDFNNPYDKTRANDWLEGKTFSFLIDYLNANGAIEFRIFIQSSSCNAPAGIPPPSLLKDRAVDLAFLGVVSYHFSPEYPCTLLDAIRPKEIVWIHWEDFFRKYTRNPKTVRGTDIPKFFDLPCVKPYKTKALLPWPGVVYEGR